MVLGLCSSSADNYVHRQSCLYYIAHPVELGILLKFKGSTLDKTKGVCTRQTPNTSSFGMNFVFEEITLVNHHCSFIMVQSVSHCYLERGALLVSTSHQLKLVPISHL